MGERSWIRLWILNILAVYSSWALRFIMIDVPSPTTSGESVELTCSFELDNDKLYSVKWYKNDDEFYRYVPNDYPAAQFLSMPGIRVDLSRSGPKSVYLKNINLTTAGTYRCEVSAEAPEFTTIEESKEMKVFVLPSEGPKILGSKPNYNIGSRVELNCTSARSKPASLLRWYINEQPAGTDYETDYSTTLHTDGLESSSLGLRFIVTEQHFQSGNMKLKCTATISRIYTMSSNEALLFGGRQQSSGFHISENANHATSSSFSAKNLQSYQIFYSMITTFMATYITQSFIAILNSDRLSLHTIGA